MQGEPQAAPKKKGLTKSSLVWAFLGVVVATLLVGFAGFDWKTSGIARQYAEEAANRTKAEFAGALCAERFLRGEDAAARLSELKNESKWNRDNYIEQGGWATFATSDKPLNAAAAICAEALVEMPAPGSQEARG